MELDTKQIFKGEFLGRVHLIFFWHMSSPAARVVVRSVLCMYILDFLEDNVELCHTARPQHCATISLFPSWLF